MRDRFPHPPIAPDTTGRICYVDNLAGVGVTDHDAQVTMLSMCQGLIDADLPLEKDEDGASTLLGFELIRGTVWRPTRGRFHKVSRALHGFCGRIGDGQAKSSSVSSDM